MFNDLEAVLARYREGQTVLRRMGRRTEPSHFSVGPPASESSLSSAEDTLGYYLPDDFTAFLRLWNGADLYAPDEYGGGICIYSIETLLEENKANYRFEYEPREVLIIGKPDGEAELFLDLRQPDYSDWAVYWADLHETVEEALAREPIAKSFRDFITRLVSAQGDFYWEKPDFTPIWRVESPELWRHSLGWYVTKGRRPQPIIGIGGYDRAPLTSPLAARILVGIIRSLKEHGAIPVSSQEMGWGPSAHPLFLVSEELLSEFDPAVIPAVEVPRTGWVEMEKGIWLHGPEEAACYVYDLYDYVNGKKSLTPSYTKVDLSWSEADAGDVADAVRQRLEALGAYLSWPAHVADGYESVGAHLWTPTRFEP